MQPSFKLLERNLSVGSRSCMDEDALGCMFVFHLVCISAEHQEEQDQTSSHFVSTAIYTIKFPLLLPSF